jgi:hypothetical protein
LDGRRPRLLGLAFLILALCGLTALAGIVPARADEVTEAQEENGDSRVYSGIHFRNSTVVGITQGEQIGRQAIAQYLQPYRP